MLGKSNNASLFQARLYWATIRRWLSVTSIVPIVLGTILVIAASFKTFELTTSTETNELPQQRWMVVVVVACELVVGISLAIGTVSTITRLAGISWFLALLGVSVYRLIAGFDSCGCLGAVRVPPEWTVFFNAAAIVMLAGFRHPRLAKSEFALVQRGALVLTALLVLVAIGAAGIRTFGGPRFLEPVGYVVKAFPPQ
jgi:hypothetical protein